MNRFQYPVLLTRAEEGGYVVTSRDLPELVTQGETVEDALEQAADAMDEVFATYLTEGLDFPEPSKAKRREHMVAPPPETVAKAALYVAMRQAGISKMQLAKRLGVDEKEVRRLWIRATDPSCRESPRQLASWGNASSSESRRPDRRRAANSSRSGSGKCPELNGR